MTSLRDRVLTRRVARAMTSPSGILLGGAGAAVTIAAAPAALPVALALGAGVGAAIYVARVALAIPRAPRSQVDVSQLSEPWRTFVADAVDARQRYERALGTAAGGPLRDRLSEIGRRLDTGVEESWRIARRGMALEAAMRQLEDPRRVRARLEDARRHRADSRIVDSLQAQLDSTERIATVAAEARRRLQVLDARLDEAVARAVELSLSADHTGDLSGVDTAVDAVVSDMEALRQALEETHRATPSPHP